MLSIPSENRRENSNIITKKKCIRGIKLDLYQKRYKLMKAINLPSHQEVIVDHKANVATL